MDGRMNARMNGQMDGRMDGRMVCLSALVIIEIIKIIT